MLYIKKETHLGFDWHDAHVLTGYIPKNKAEEGDFDITGLNPTLLIADDIIDKLKNGVGYTSEDAEGNVEEEKITESYIPSFQEMVEILSEKKRWELPEEASNCISAFISYDDGAVKCSTNTCGYDSTSYYDVFEVSDEQVRYLAIEEIYAPYKGAYTIQRIYDNPFTSYKEAKAALDKIPAVRERYDTGRVVLIASTENIKEDHFKNWFSNNMKLKQAEEADPGKFYLSVREIA